jgi:acyl phosphate:glycerol-3-phosphate acyltransferase
VQPYLIGVLAGYLVGSIPSAYLVVRKRSGIDIRAVGSGNVGSFNAFVATKSAWTGIVVGLLDGAKGLAVVLGSTFAWHDFWPTGVALLAAVLGHIYPFWLRFRGGRGLATACGGLFGMGLGYTIAWCITWIVVKLSGYRLLSANIAAIVAAPVVLWIVPGDWLALVTWFPDSAMDFKIFGTILSGVLMVGHLNVFFGSGEISQKSEGVHR